MVGEGKAHVVFNITPLAPYQNALRQRAPSLARRPLALYLDLYTCHRGARLIPSDTGHWMFAFDGIAGSLTQYRQCCHSEVPPAPASGAGERGNGPCDIPTRASRSD